MAVVHEFVNKTDVRGRASGRLKRGRNLQLERRKYNNRKNADGTPIAPAERFSLALPVSGKFPAKSGFQRT
jgi:hypothetical protein